MTVAWRLVSLVLASVLPLACASVGPRALRVAHPQYNAAVRAVEDEELLLNLVRLRYLDPIKFLQVGTLSAQFSVNVDAGAEVGHEDDVTSVLGTAGVGYRDAPTLTFLPRDDNDFARLLTTPVDVDTLASLSRGASGWRWPLALCALTINGAWIRTEAGAGSRFWARAETLTRLVRSGDVTLGYTLDAVPLTEPLATASVSAADQIRAAEKGYRFQDTGDGRHVVLVQPRRRPALHVAPDARARVAGELESLGLAPGRAVYPIRPSEELGRAVEGSDALHLGTRSVLGILAVLSEGVEVPPAHVLAGHAPPVSSRTFIEGGGRVADVFRVRSGRARPCARLAVRHRDWWFWIDDADQTSRRVFLLLALFYDLELSARRSGSDGPVLTLPVG